MNQHIYHIPALLGPTIEGLDIHPGGIYVDLTYGGGGHSRAILDKIDGKGHLYGFDQDIDAVRRAPADDPRFTIVHSNFRFLRNFMRYYGEEHVDGILADLGVSFHHFDDADRGFSFRFDGPLDMRMNRSATLSAADIVATYTPERLTEIFRTYGELQQAKRLAAALVKARATTPITTVQALVDTVTPLLDQRRLKKELACVFQALRIEVNDEMGALADMLGQCVRLLRPGTGRLCVITYHSLEDRIVKNFIRTGNIHGTQSRSDAEAIFGQRRPPLQAVNTRPIVPDEDEIEANPRSRSAKLRIARRTDTPA